MSRTNWTSSNTFLPYDCDGWDCIFSWFGSLFRLCFWLKINAQPVLCCYHKCPPITTALLAVLFKFSSGRTISTAFEGLRALLAETMEFLHFERSPKGLFFAWYRNAEGRERKRKIRRRCKRKGFFRKEGELWDNTLLWIIIQVIYCGTTWYVSHAALCNCQLPMRESNFKSFLYGFTSNDAMVKAPVFRFWSAHQHKWWEKVVFLALDRV